MILTDIFSHFDAFIISSYSFVLFFGLQLALVLIMVPSQSALAGRASLGPATFSLMAKGQTSSTLSKFLQSFTPMSALIFSLIVTGNFVGILPGTFSATSHLVITMGLAFPVWLAIMLSSLALKPTSSVAHFTPKAAPLSLTIPLAIIETVSSLIRPLTLSLRLAANMTAGHVVLSLLANSSWVAQSAYLFFELAICLIQGYIFCLLIALYVNDHSYS